ncbi:MAG TPA: ABC transporter permease [Aggregatilineaceae bacterium]|jgi:peptide/nickel transport system permease protein|nr:ABC transporter permease [Anaerolineae bacterium]HMM27143.1 ABC transporter permease [Aggregatilineaceae bacterium]
MLRYLMQRAIAFVPTVLGVTLLVFFAIRAIPGDAITAMLGTEAGMLTANQRAALEEYFGLDKPAYVQYFNWLGNLLQGDLGYSVRHGQPVLDVILARFPVTLELAVLAVLIALAIGLTFGMIAAIFHNSVIDLFGQLFALIGLAAPNFLIGTLIIYVLSVYFGILPNAGNYVDLTEDPVKNFEQIIFPAITLGFAFSASVMRMTRSAMLEVLGQDYIRTARSKGLRERAIISRHALRNALIPIVTLVGVEAGYLLGGTVIVEEIFTLPGIGRLAYNAISQRDYALIQGVTLFIALNFVVINLVVDFVYTLLDPRISYAKHS